MDIPINNEPGKNETIDTLGAKALISRLERDFVQSVVPFLQVPKLSVTGDAESNTITMEVQIPLWLIENDWDLRYDLASQRIETIKKQIADNCDTDTMGRTLAEIAWLLDCTVDELFEGDDVSAS